MMKKVLTALFLLCCLLPILGCSMNVAGERQIQALAWEKIQQRKYEAPICVDNVRAFYEPDYRHQAEYVVQSYVSALSCIRQSTGFQPCIKEIRFYFVKAEETVPRRDFYAPNGGEEFNLLFAVKSSDQSCESLLAGNGLYPYVLVHEVAEFSLIMGKESTPIAPDFSQPFWPLQRRGMKYTRWFREGFANYCGYLAHRQVWSELDPKKPGVFYSDIEGWVHSHPFSALQTVGKNLFTWPQYCNGKCDGNALHYEAALGLFLLIRDVYGEKTIKSIIADIPTLKKADGPALIALVNSKINGDVEELAENFTFPITGLESATVVASEESKKDWPDGAYVTKVVLDSPAEKAGFREGDFICKVNGTDIKTNLDWEMFLYKNRNCQIFEIALERDGREKVVNLQLVE